MSRNYLSPEGMQLQTQAWAIYSLTGYDVCAQSCPAVCNPMDCRPPCSSVHGISQARILEWVAISFSRGSSQPRDQTHISCLSCRWILYHYATWEAQRGYYGPIQKPKPFPGAWSQGRFLSPHPPCFWIACLFFMSMLVNVKGKKTNQKR